MKETSNPVVWQSRTWLMDALAALMEEKKFEEITVVEICRRPVSKLLRTPVQGVCPVSGTGYRLFCGAYHRGVFFVLERA